MPPCPRAKCPRRIGARIADETRRPFIRRFNQQTRSVRRERVDQNLTMIFERGSQELRTDNSDGMRIRKIRRGVSGGEGEKDEHDARYACAVPVQAKAGPYFMNSISRYVGSGQIWCGISSSRRSPVSRSAL